MTDTMTTSVGGGRDAAPNRMSDGELPELPYWKRVLRKIGPQNAGLLIALVLLCGLLSIGTDKLFLPSNLINIGLAVAVLGILAVAQTVVIISGGLDISIGSMAILASVGLGLASQAGISDGPAALIALAVGLAAGALNGLIVVLLRISPIIVTLATFTAFSGIAYVISNGLEIAVTGNFFLELGTGRALGIPYPLWLLAGFALLVHIFLKYSVGGRHVFATGSNESASRNTGISLSRLRICVYAFSGLAAGIAGVLTVANNGLAVASAGGAAAGLDAITAALLGGAALAGGRGTVLGTLIGVLLLGILDNGLILINANPFYSQIVVGILLIVAIALQQSSVFARLSGRSNARRSK